MIQKVIITSVTATWLSQTCNGRIATNSDARNAPNSENPSSPASRNTTTHVSVP